MNKTHNEKRKLIILLPKILRTGPILGAFAIANTLVDEFSITIVSIKGGVEDQIEIKEGIFLEDLSRYKDWLKELKDSILCWKIVMIEMLSYRCVFLPTFSMRFL